MSCFSCRRKTFVQPVVTPVFCPNPVLQIGFPLTAPGPNAVTLANGAVVDLDLLGGIISQFCPGVACPRNIVISTRATSFDP